MDDPVPAKGSPDWHSCLKETELWTEKEECERPQTTEAKPGFSGTSLDVHEQLIDRRTVNEPLKYLQVTAGFGKIS